MEVTLYYSTLCRLCAEENPSGTLLYENNEDESDLSLLINKYLPLKVNDDGKLPRTICPGCNIQLEATVQFLELIVGGQMVLRELLRSQMALKRAGKNSLLQDDNNKEILVQIMEDGSLYAPDHTVTLRVEGLEKPRRKRGRPPKKLKPPSVPEEAIEVEDEHGSLNKDVEDSPTDIDGRKRRRKTPKRFKEAVQGKELERIFREEGVIDGNESDSGGSEDRTAMAPFSDMKEGGNNGDEVIGHMENPDGTSLGQLVIVNKAKGRGRPRGRGRSIRQTCNICSLEFTSLGKYMSHVATHHTSQALESQSVEPDVTTAMAEEIGEDNDFSKVVDSNVECVPDLFFENEPTESVLQTDNIIGDDTVVNSENNDEKSVGEIFESTQITEDIPDNNTPDVNVDFIEHAEIEMQEASTDKLVRVKIGTKFQCTQCSKSFNSKQSCDVHIKASHLGQKPFKCDQCDKSFPYQVTLKQHMLLHFPKAERGYACDLCGKVLNHPSSVIYHKEAEHNNGRRFVCNKCDRSFKHRQLLQRHQLVHSENRPFVCKVCNASFKTKANLMNHQPTHTGVKKFGCEICNQQFAHKASLTLHLRWHSGQKPYQCTVCGKSFSQNGNLAEHMRIHTGEKPYVCSICQRRFTTSSQHRLHLQRHSGERPWQCQDCGKRFLSKETWRCHIRRHRGERPFACTQCDRTFTERWALRKHYRLHSGERPYTCNICSRSFADCSNLTKHKKTHRENDVLKTIPVVRMEDSVSCIMGNMNDSTDGVVYVTYHSTGDDEEGTPTYHIINKDSEVKDLNALYDTESNQLVTENTISIEDERTSEPGSPISNALFDQVIDQDGNPIHFTMQDGTQLAFSSPDGGQSLQVTTEDGEIIPVQLSDKTDVGDLGESLTITAETENMVDSEEYLQPIKILGPGGQVRFITALDENNLSHYITFA